jgi:hypothetical protein
VCDTSRLTTPQPRWPARSFCAAATLQRAFTRDDLSRLESGPPASAGAPIIFKDSFITRENDARTRRECAPKPMGLTELGKITAHSQGAYAGATLQLPTFD